MHKFRWMIAVIILSLAFSACGNLQDSEGPTSGEGSENFPQVTEVVPTGTVAVEGPDAEQTPQVSIPTQQAEEPGEVPPQNMLPPDPLNTAVLVNSLLTYHVATAEGRFGQVSGIALDAFSGQVEYLGVYSVGPEPQRDYLLPWNALQIVTLPEDQSLEGARPAPAVYITLEEDTLANAPEFDLDTIGEEKAPNWDADLRAYWAEHLPEMPVTGEEGMTARNTLWISGSMFGGVEFDVLNNEGENMGEIEDFIIAPDGAIAFGLLDPGVFMSVGNQRIVVAWSALSWLPEEQHFLMNVSSDALDDAPRFDPAQMPDMTVPGWEGPWNEYWQNSPDAQQQDPSQPASSTATAAPESLSPMFASMLQGHPIDGESAEVGAVSDWWVGSMGNSDFILLDIQDRPVLVPWQALIWQPAESRLGLNVAREVVENAPIYEGEEVDAEGRTWHARADAYWNQYLTLPEPVPASAPEGEQPWALVSNLLGNEVQDVAGATLGSVGDFVIHADGSVLYVAVENNGRLHPIPWANFSLDPEQETLTFIDDTERFQAAPGFASVDEMDLNNSEWDVEYLKYWGIE